MFVVLCADMLEFTLFLSYIVMEILLTFWQSLEMSFYFTVLAARFSKF